MDFTNTDSFTAMNPQLPLGPPNHAHTAAVDSHGFSNPFQNQAIQMSSFPLDSTPPPALERRFTDAYGSADQGRHGRLLNFLEERRQSAPPAPLAQHIPVPMPPPPPPLSPPPMQAGAPTVIVQPPKKSPPSNVSCTVCCDQFTAEQEPSSVLRPCRTCRSIYCTSCVKDMFIKACKDPSRMPPRCCNMLQLHFALPFLSKAEAVEYRFVSSNLTTFALVYKSIKTNKTTERNTRNGVHRILYTALFPFVPHSSPTVLYHPHQSLRKPASNVPIRSLKSSNPPRLRAQSVAPIYA